MFVRVRYTDAEGRRREKKRALAKITDARALKEAIHVEIEEENALTFPQEGEPEPDSDSGDDDMIKKVYSPRYKRDVWMYDVRVGARRLRQSGFATKREARQALESLISATTSQRRDERRERIASEITAGRIVEEAVAQRIAAAVAPLHAEIRRLRADSNHKPKEGPVLLTILEAARLSGISEGYLRAAIKAGRLRAIKLGVKFKKIERSELDRYVKQVSTAGDVNAVPALDDDEKKGPGRKAAITEETVRLALEALGPYVPQEKLAAHLGVESRSVRKWLKERGLTYPQLRERYTNNGTG